VITLAIILPAVVALLALYSIGAVFACIELNDGWHAWCPLCVLLAAVARVLEWKWSRP